ncbi:MAG: YcbK family protein [Nitrospira sp.]|nr:YcbK family protein [Candidatus Brocadiales bacterium]MBL7048360.1 YcbK family protein [Nitrospira sp.]
MNRRSFLTMGLVAAAAFINPVKALASLDTVQDDERLISLYNPTTKESLSLVYYRKGTYHPDCMEQINHIFRDHRTGKIKPIDENLIDLLSKVQADTKTSTPFHIISGYRTPRSNALLRKTMNGVAKKSFHMYGQAADIRLPGYSLKKLRKVLMKQKMGGVGYYSKSRFIHVDVGEVRYWWG